MAPVQRLPFCLFEPVTSVAPMRPVSKGSPDTGKDHRMLHYLYSTDHHEQGTAYSGFFLSFLKIHPILHDDMGIGKNYDIMKTENSLFMKES